MTWEEPTNLLCCGDLGVPGSSWWALQSKMWARALLTIENCGFSSCELLAPQSRRKDTWICVFIDIFPFKKSKAFLANIFLDSDLKEIHFFWLFCMNTTPQGYLLPTLRTFSGRSPHLEDSHFLCNGTNFHAPFMSLCWLCIHNTLGQRPCLFINYFTDFFPPADI